VYTVQQNLILPFEMKACNNRKLLHGQLFSGLLLKQQIIINFYKKNNQPTNQPTKKPIFFNLLRKILTFFSGNAGPFS